MNLAKLVGPPASAIARSSAPIFVSSVAASIRPRYQVSLDFVKRHEMDSFRAAANNQLMIDNKETLAQRLDSLRAGMTYAALAEAIERKTGLLITAQTVHNWCSGKTDITEDKLKVVAEFFGVSASWLRYGEGSMTERNALETAITALPEDDRQQVLDFVRYKIERADTLFASEKASSYLAMIDRLVEDMKKRRAE